MLLEKLRLCLTESRRMMFRYPQRHIVDMQAGLGNSLQANELARLFDTSVGFDLVRDGQFLFGSDHPSVTSIGRSMKSAFQPFDQAFRAVFKVNYRALDLSYYEAGPVVTFGSPSSNRLSRIAMGYDFDDSSLRVPWLGHSEGLPIPYDLPIRFELDRPGEVVRATYNEPDWGISLASSQHSGRVLLVPQTDDAGRLAEDYLVLSCIPNLASIATRERMKAIGELNSIAAAAGGRPLLMIDDATERERRRNLIRQADQPIDRLLVIGGLHGPATAAANLLLSDARQLKRLQEIIRSDAVEGGFWQALVKVDRVDHDLRSGLDTPGSLDAGMQVFPITGIPSLPSAASPLAIG